MDAQWIRRRLELAGYESNVVVKRERQYKELQEKIFIKMGDENVYFYAEESP